MSISIRLETDRAIIRWHCPLCSGETWKQSARVAIYDGETFVGAVCPDCLKDNDVLRTTGQLQCRLLSESNQTDSEATS